MENKCAICIKRISNWESAAGKTCEVDGYHIHNACKDDFELKTGKVWSRWEVVKELLGGAHP